MAGHHPVDSDQPASLGRVFFRLDEPQRVEERDVDTVLDLVLEHAEVATDQLQRTERVRDLALAFRSKRFIPVGPRWWAPTAGRLVRVPIIPPLGGSITTISATTTTKSATRRRTRCWVSFSNRRNI